MYRRRARAAVIDGWCEADTYLFGLDVGRVCVADDPDYEPAYHPYGAPAVDELRTNAFILGMWDAVRGW